MTALTTTAKVEDLHRLASQHAGNAVQYAIECGRELVRIKGELAHGEFGKWCEGLTFSYRTAKTYMQAAGRAPQIGSTAAHLVTDPAPSLRSFMAATAPPKKAAPAAKHIAPSRISDANKRRIEAIDEARSRGVSMLTTYARLTLTALRSQTSFTNEEKKVIQDLAEAIQQVSEYQR